MGVPAGIMGPLTDLFLEVRVDAAKCASCGRCLEACPGVFESWCGIARAKMIRVPRELEDACFDALEDCPSGAITISEVKDVLFGLAAS